MGLQMYVHLFSCLARSQIVYFQLAHYGPVDHGYKVDEKQALWFGPQQFGEKSDCGVKSS